MRLLLLIISISSFIGFSQDDKEDVIKWYGFEAAIDANEEDRKPIFIDIYTSWCGWCVKMDNSTFKDPRVVSYMNEHFYAVKMDAESKDAIAFKKKLYESKTYGNKTYNELAYNLLGGRMSFPTFVVLSKRQVKIGTINGFKKPKELLSILEKYENK